MKRATVYIVILGIVCTALGVTIGVTLEKRYTARNLPNIVRRQLLGHPRAARMLGKRARVAQKAKVKAVAGKLFEHIGQKLNLTAEQKEEVRAILEGTKEQVKQTRDEFRTQVAQVREESNAKIAEILNPEQREKYEKLLAGLEERREKRSKR